MPYNTTVLCYSLEYRLYLTLASNSGAQYQYRQKDAFSTDARVGWCQGTRILGGIWAVLYQRLLEEVHPKRFIRWGHVGTWGNLAGEFQI